MNARTPIRSPHQPRALPPLAHPTAEPSSHDSSSGESPPCHHSTFDILHSPAQKKDGQTNPKSHLTLSKTRLAPKNEPKTNPPRRPTKPKKTQRSKIDLARIPRAARAKATRLGGGRWKNRSLTVAARFLVPPGRFAQRRGTHTGGRAACGTTMTPVSPRTNSTSRPHATPGHRRYTGVWSPRARASGRALEGSLRNTSRS